MTACAAFIIAPRDGSVCVCVCVCRDSPLALCSTRANCRRANFQMTFLQVCIVVAPREPRRRRNLFLAFLPPREDALASALSAKIPRDWSRRFFRSRFVRVLLLLLFLLRHFDRVRHFRRRLLCTLESRGRRTGSPNRSNLRAQNGTREQIEKLVLTQRNTKEREKESLRTFSRDYSI